MSRPLPQFVSEVAGTLAESDPAVIFAAAALSKTGLFYGAAGMAYFLLEAARGTRDAALIHHADRFCRFAESYADTAGPGGEAGTVPGPLLNARRSISAGTGGVGYTRALIAASMARDDEVRAGVDMLAEAWAGTAALGREMAVELHFGAAGFACAATDLLLRLPDPPPSVTDVLARVQEESALHLVASLERPLMDRADPVGLAHGVAGPLYACLRVGVAPELIARRIDEFIDLAIDQPPLILWPSALDTRQPDDLPISLCRGLSGVLILLTNAAQALRSERISEFAARAAFMLRKLPVIPPGICCGAAGQAIAASQYAAISGCSTSRRWANARLRWAAARASVVEPPPGLWYGRAGIALAALTISGRGALPLFAAAGRGGRIAPGRPAETIQQTHREGLQ